MCHVTRYTSTLQGVVLFISRDKWVGRSKKKLKSKEKIVPTRNTSDEGLSFLII